MKYNMHKVLVVLQQSYTRRETIGEIGADEGIHPHQIAPHRHCAGVVRLPFEPLP